jgi:hypothetical protein
MPRSRSRLHPHGAVTCTVAAMLLMCPPAAADEYETSVDLHLTAGAARVGEEGARDAVTVPWGGVVARMSYGLRDWLAVHGELAFSQLDTARFDDVTVTLEGGGVMTGPLERVTRAGGGLAGVSVRLGVVFVPVVEASAGLQARWRSAAVFVPLHAVPDGHAEEVSLDLVLAARVGLDYRINRRWIAGVRVGGLHAVAVGAPAFDAAEVTATIAYTWYRRWWWWEG